MANKNGLQSKQALRSWTEQIAFLQRPPTAESPFPLDLEITMHGANAVAQTAPAAFFHAISDENMKHMYTDDNGTDLENRQQALAMEKVMACLESGQGTALKSLREFGSQWDAPDTAVSSAGLKSEMYDLNFIVFFPKYPEDPSMTVHERKTKANEVLSRVESGSELGKVFQVYNVGRDIIRIARSRVEKMEQGVQASAKYMQLWKEAETSDETGNEKLKELQELARSDPTLVKTFHVEVAALKTQTIKAWSERFFGEFVDMPPFATMDDANKVNWNSDAQRVVTRLETLVEMPNLLGEEDVQEYKTMLELAIVKKQYLSFELGKKSLAVQLYKDCVFQIICRLKHAVCLYLVARTCTS